MAAVVLLTFAIAGLAAPAVTRAQATQSRSALATPVRHVVVLYLENHSFDNVLGFWCDQHPGRCPDGGMPSSVKLSNGAVVKPRVDPDVVPIGKHNVAAQLAAIDGGKMDGWGNIPGGSCDAATGYRCVSGYTPSQVPNVTALASHFAISDHTFSMGDSSSWGGHLYAALASLDRFLGNNPVPPPAPRTGTGAATTRR